MAAAPAGRPTNDQVTAVSAVFIPTFNFLAVYPVQSPYVVYPGFALCSVQDFDNLRIKKLLEKIKILGKKQ
jgi:hypothetical protein